MQIKLNALTGPVSFCAVIWFNLFMGYFCIIAPGAQQIFVDRPRLRRRFAGGQRRGDSA